VRSRLTENKPHHTFVLESNVLQMCAKAFYLLRALVLLRTAQITKSRTKYVTAKDKGFLVKGNTLPDKPKA